MPPGRGIWFLAAAFLAGAVALYAAARLEELPYAARNMQMRAAALMAECEKEAYRFAEEQGLAFNPAEDPNATGLIGPEYAEFTTTIGNLQAKRTSVDPAFAALLVRYFHELGLEKGDVVAIGTSGSFPGLILATLCAAEVMQLEPALIYSLGASMHGAGAYAFTGLEMLALWREKGLLPYEALAVSLGGGNDQADDCIFPDVRPRFLQKAEKSGLPFINEPLLANSEKRRLEIYSAFAERHGKKGSACFVNIGGASVNTGNSSALVSLRNGITIPAPGALPHGGPGLVSSFLREGTPVIHLLNIKELALKNGIPVDASPFPAIGEGPVYMRGGSGGGRALLLAGALLLCLGLCARARPFWPARSQS